MNRLFTSTSRVLAALFFVAVTTESAAQSFPLPYNPDENGDGLIGVVDLQGLLANYGSEFSGAVISEDGESAITFMGEMPYAHCKYSCMQLPGYWSLPNLEDLVPVWNEVYNNESPSTWLYAEQSDVLDGTSSSSQYLYPYFRGNELYPIGAYVQLIPNGFTTEMRCYCAAKQLPRVEYTYCEGTDIQECANEKVEAGWYPLEGITKISYNGQNKIQAFWRWAE